MPIGAEFFADRSATHLRVWAPGRFRVQVCFEGGCEPVALHAEGNGYFSGFAQGIGPGARYQYRLDDEGPYPDPASRYQPQGPHGFSQIIDPDPFPWTDQNWPGVSPKGLVIYELHLGTFTPAGTWSGAAEKLEYLRDTGINLIEVMPVADFVGKFGWGYDGVQLYAPASIYGTPDDMRGFIDRAHALGIGVILDVVYNHVGPDGNYLPAFSSAYFSTHQGTDWGPAINFDGEQSGPVREFFRENAVYWIREFHLDGLRFDATQDIHDTSKPHILAEISQAVRAAAAPRSIFLVGENEPQETNLVKPVEAGGCGLDALWNDDYHHTAMVALTGKREAYYNDYRGTPQEFVSAAKYGYLFQGQRYRWQKQRRGTPTYQMEHSAFVNFIQNHDQVANSATGKRIHELAAPGAVRAITALTLLMPGTPMLFQGQEFGSSSRFLFFADHKQELAEKIAQGRVQFLRQWRSLRRPDVAQYLHDPCSSETFQLCKLNHSEVQTHAETYALHRDLLRLRRFDTVISRQAAEGMDGAVLASHCFLLRFFSPDGMDDRLLIVNLGEDLELDPAPEPLLAPPQEMRWATLWSSDEPQYGGTGTAPLETKDGWRIPGLAAVVLRPEPASHNLSS